MVFALIFQIIYLLQQNQSLRKNQVIRKCLASLMLVIFVFSLTPKIFLHSLIATHKDTFSNSLDTKTHIEKKGFHCDCDDLVVESPFIPNDVNFNVVIPTLYPQLSAQEINNFSSAFPISFGLRGPPVLLHA
jgi:hypothetical protein